MKHSNRTNLKGTMLVLIDRLRAILRTDYSLSDLNLVAIRSWILSYLQMRSKEGVSSLTHLDRGWFMRAFTNVVIRGRKRLIYLAAAISLSLMLIFVLLPYERRLTDRISLRPAQWGYLQNLIAHSQSHTISTNTQSPFEEPELQGLKATLLSRDIKPITLVMISRDPAKIEIKANEVLFSALLDVLEQVRIQWNLYPEELNIQASNMPAVVTIHGYLVQQLPPEVPDLGGVQR